MKSRLWWDDIHLSMFPFLQSPSVSFWSSRGSVHVMALEIRYKSAVYRARESPLTTQGLFWTAGTLEHTMLSCFSASNHIPATSPVNNRLDLREVLELKCWKAQYCSSFRASYSVKCLFKGRAFNKGCRSRWPPVKLQIKLNFVHSLEGNRCLKF